MSDLIKGFGTSFVPIMGIAAGTYRVPMQHLPDTQKYALSTGYHQIRYFNDTTLPSTVKALITMVKAFPETHGGVIAGYTHAYIPPTEAQIEIGWKFGPQHYMLIMKNEDFSQLEIPHGNNT